jgi:cysteine-rich repeat protein
MRRLLWTLLLVPLLVWAQTQPTSTPTTQPVPVCGNGIVEKGESCDDGNSKNYDGCFECRKAAKGGGPAYEGICGDGQIDDGEECDGGRNCSNECKLLPKKPPKIKIPSSTSYTSTPTVSKLDPDRGFQVAVTLTFFGPPGLGLIYGPSAGHFYAGELGRPITMTLIRGALVGGMIATRNSIGDGGIDVEGGRVLLAAEALAFSTLIVVDLLDASNAVRRATGQPQIKGLTP